MLSGECFSMEFQVSLISIETVDEFYVWHMPVNSTFFWHKTLTYVESFEEDWIWIICYVVSVLLPGKCWIMRRFMVGISHVLFGVCFTVFDFDTHESCSTFELITLWLDNALILYKVLILFNFHRLRSS